MEREGGTEKKRVIAIRGRISVSVFQNNSVITVCNHSICISKQLGQKYSKRKQTTCQKRKNIDHVLHACMSCQTAPSKICTNTRPELEISRKNYLAPNFDCGDVERLP